MKIGIIGAGFGGLSAGYYLAKAGHEITIFESGDKPGGLAIGFKDSKWKWTLEEHYHHWFTNDDSVLDLVRKIGHKVHIVRPKTSTYISGNVFQLDSPLSLLKFKKLSISDRVRTGLVLAYLKITNDWKTLERTTAKKFILMTMGVTSWNVLWRPLFEKKFGNFADQIPASWFWSRIKKRTQSLAYPEGGFQTFANALESAYKKYGGIIHYNSPVELIKSQKDGIQITTPKMKYTFDKVICTLPTFIFTKITPELPKSYLSKLKSLNGIGAVNLVLSLKKQFMTDGSYWLNVNEMDYPFLAVVEHTNFMNMRNYNNEHLVYIGNYLSSDHPYFQKSGADLVKEFMPYLTKINPDFSKKDIIKAYVFKAPFAQPIIPLNYSKYIPDFETPVKNLYLCNMQQVYPWDRGTNYAVENGKKIAEIIVKS